MRIHPSEIAFIIGFVAYIVIRGIFAARSKRAAGVIKRATDGERVLLVVMLVGGMVLPIVYLITPLLSFADYRRPLVANVIGTVLMLAALWLFWRSHADLADNWSITLEIREGHRLVTHGVYAAIRHPMYAAIWLFSLAQGLLLQNWLAGWSAFVAFAIMYFARVSREERLMTDHFGEEYRDYASSTGRVFPKIRK